MSRPCRWLSTLLVAFCSCATACPAATTSVDDLPLLELPVTSNSSDTFAILLSGDDGWSALDKAVAGELNAHGIAVVGCFDGDYATLAAASSVSWLFEHGVSC